MARRNRPQGGPPPRSMLGREMPRNAIFISYTREDLAAVQELKAGLEARRACPSGSISRAWNPATTSNTRSSSTSRGRAVVSWRSSPRTPNGARGLFPPRMDAGGSSGTGAFIDTQSFIVPVVVDDTAEPSLVPARFSQLNYTWLPGGKVTPAFVGDY